MIQTLPKILFPPALNTKDARIQAGIFARAKTLFDEDAYTLEAVPDAWDSLYRVFGKDGAVYVVDARSRCSCQGFEWHGDCKHRVGVALKLGLLTEADLVVVRADVRRAV